MASAPPIDFLGTAGALASLPRPYDAMQQVAQDQQQRQGNDQSLNLGALKLAALGQQQQQAQQYQADVATALKTNDFAGLYAKYPEHQKELQAAHDALDEPTKRANERDLFAVRSYITAGTPAALNSAKSVLQKRIDADRAAGQPVDDDQQMLDALNSGDPKRCQGCG
jgi:hypothetical protein